MYCIIKFIVQGKQAHVKIANLRHPSSMCQQEQTIPGHRFETRQFLPPLRTELRELIDNSERYIVYELSEDAVSDLPPPQPLRVDSFSLVQSLHSPVGTTEIQNPAEPNYTFLNISISLYPCGVYLRVLNYTKCLCFLFCGAGVLRACGKGTAVAVNYSCLRPRLNIRKIR